MEPICKSIFDGGSIDCCGCIVSGLIVVWFLSLKSESMLIFTQQALQLNSKLLCGLADSQIYTSVHGGNDQSW